MTVGYLCTVLMGQAREKTRGWASSYSNWQSGVRRAAKTATSWPGYLRVLDAVVSSARIGESVASDGPTEKSAFVVYSATGRLVSPVWRYGLSTNEDDRVELLGESVGGVEQDSTGLYGERFRCARRLGSPSSTPVVLLPLRVLGWRR